MNRKAFAITFVLTLLASLFLAEIWFVNLAKANPFPTAPVISIESPTNRTYTSNSLFLNVTLVTYWDGVYFSSISRRVSYCIDGKESIRITATAYWFDEEKQASIFRGSAVLADLTEGLHELRINAEYSYGNGKAFVSDSSVNFKIDFTYSPSPTPAPTPSPTPAATPSPTATPTPEPISTSSSPPFSTIFVATASVGSVFGALTALMIYFKRRKR
jgi:hypothetical protein